jgi:hypothetical protein
MHTLPDAPGDHPGRAFAASDLNSLPLLLLLLLRVTTQAPHQVVSLQLQTSTACRCCRPPSRKRCGCARLCPMEARGTWWTREAQNCAATRSPRWVGGCRAVGRPVCGLTVPKVAMCSLEDLECVKPAACVCLAASSSPWQPVPGFQA